MMTLQQVPEAPIILQKHLFTIDDYHKMAETGILKPTDHVELINGEIITMSPIKSPHAGIVNILNRILTLLLKETVTICVQNPIVINKTSEPEPDLVIAKFRKDGYFEEHPHPEDIHIVIEVADSTLKSDRKIKAPLYAKAGISEYWIVNIPDKKIEVRTMPTPKEYKDLKKFRKGDTLTATAIPFSLKVDEVFFK